MPRPSPPRPGRGRPPPTPLGPDRAALAAAHVPLALGIARRFRLRWPGLDGDAIDSGALWGLACAAGRYRPVEGVPFAVYARHRVLGECRSAIAAERRAEPTSAEAAVGTLDPSDPTAAVDARDEVYVLLGRLPGPHRAVVAASLAADAPDGRTLAARLGRSQARVSALLVEAREILREGRR